MKGIREFNVFPLLALGVCLGFGYLSLQTIDRIIESGAWMTSFERLSQGESLNAWDVFHFWGLIPPSALLFFLVPVLFLMLIALCGKATPWRGLLAFGLFCNLLLRFLTPVVYTASDALTQGVGAFIGKMATVISSEPLNYVMNFFAYSSLWSLLLYVQVFFAIYLLFDSPYKDDTVAVGEDDDEWSARPGV
uniref:hypothetical protein n=1 Tax=Thaumasiovibrio occultus TaxID=1891184 RepID=UPI000B3597AD|nr:hypothetical protein [Thaumasiovibrio occultus]